MDKGYNQNKTLIKQLTLMEAYENQIPYMLEKLDEAIDEEEYQEILTQRAKDLWLRD